MDRFPIRPFLGVVLFLLIVLPGCEDPEKKKERQKQEIEKVYAQVVDVMLLMDVKPARPGDTNASKNSIQDLREVVDLFLQINASKCPQDFRQAISELKSLMRKVRGDLLEMEELLEKTAAFQRGELSLTEEERRIHNARAMEIAGKLTGAWSKEFVSIGNKIDTVALRYGVEPPPDPGSPKQEIAKNSKTSTSSPSREETIRYMQPVYDGLFKRLVKLREIGTEKTVSAKMRFDAAEKTRRYVDTYLESSFPADFRSILRKIENSLLQYVGTQGRHTDPGMFPADSGIDFDEREKKCLEEFQTYLTELNKVAAGHGCQVFQLP